MGLIILGIIIYIFGMISAKSQSQITRYKTILKIAGIVVFIIGLLSQSLRQIDAGHVGVQVLFGQVQPGILNEGLNIVNPLIDVKEFTTQTQNYTMSSAYAEGQKVGDDAIRVLSKDGLEVTMDMTVLYRVIPSVAPQIYRKIGIDYEDKVVRPVTRTRIRESAVDFDAIDLFSDKREAFESRIKQYIDNDFKARGFVLEQLLVRKIDLPKSVKESIERKITAVQDAQRMKYILQKEEQEAERKRVEARGVSDAQRIVNEGLTPKVLQFEMIKIQKELVNSPNSKIIILGDSKSTPFIIEGK